MAIQDKMYEQIEQEINRTVETGNQVRYVDYDRAKEVARMLTNLSTDTRDADSLTNQYIANIKNICKSKNQSI
jgi:hypothetical protein